MKFTAPEEYGLRCMVSMARNAENTSLTISELARRERLTKAYVAKLMRILRRGKLVDSSHGPTGGYRLARPAADISVGQVMAVLGSPLYGPKYCQKFPGGTPFCVHTSECAIRSLWHGLDLIVSEILMRTRLTDLIRSEHTLPQWISSQLPIAIDAAARASATEPRP